MQKFDFFTDRALTTQLSMALLSVEVGQTAVQNVWFGSRDSGISCQVTLSSDGDVGLSLDEAGPFQKTLFLSVPGGTAGAIEIFLQARPTQQIDGVSSSLSATFDWVTNG